MGLWHAVAYARTSLKIERRSPIYEARSYVRSKERFTHSARITQKLQSICLPDVRLFSL